MDKKSSEKRRKLLKSIAAGGGAIVAGKSLPENWTKPVVGNVILPAHAQTSPSFSCSITGQALIELVAGYIVAGPILYTVTNTGTGPLTGGQIDGLTVDDGTTGGIGFNSYTPDGPDPFAPGDSFTVSLNNLTANECPRVGGVGTFTINYTSNEATCSIVVDVTCTVG